MCFFRVSTALFFLLNAEHPDWGLYSTWAIMATQRNKGGMRPVGCEAWDFKPEGHTNRSRSSRQKRRAAAGRLNFWSLQSRKNTQDLKETLIQHVRKKTDSEIQGVLVFVKKTDSIFEVAHFFWISKNFFLLGSNISRCEVDRAGGRGPHSAEPSSELVEALSRAREEREELRLALAQHSAFCAEKELELQLGKKEVHYIETVIFRLWKMIFFWWMLSFLFGRRSSCFLSAFLKMRRLELEQLQDARDQERRMELRRL